MTKNHRTKSFHEKIFSASSKCPVAVGRSSDNASPSALAYHREWEFQFILTGRGFYFIAGKKHAFQPNTVFAINPNQTHYYALTPGCMMEKWRLMFLPAFLRDATLRRALASLPHQVPLTGNESAVMVLLLHRMQDELNRQATHWKEIVRLNLGEFLWLLQRAGGRTSPPPVINPLAQQIADYIEQHFTQKLSIPALAARFGYSESYLSHVFKQHMRFGIKHYLLQRRIAEARRQLAENPGVKMASVAESVGFENFGVFNRMFKLLVGITPAVYSRNSHLGSSI